MKMKLRIFYGMIGAASLLCASNLKADITLGTGTLNPITAPGYNSDGDQAGPYNIAGLIRLTGLTPLGTLSGGHITFETFCIGTQVDYTPGSGFNYQISDTVEPTGGVTLGHPPGLDYVAWGTAYLYSQYRAGAIGHGSANDATDDALQAAIWILQGQTISGVVSFGSGDPNVTTVIAAGNALISSLVVPAAASHGVSDTSDANGAFGVYSMNLYTGSLSSNPTYYQPQLCLVAVPEPTTILAGALLLLPFGASTVRILRRKNLA
jgi:hypothetical protein